MILGLLHSELWIACGCEWVDRVAQDARAGSGALSCISTTYASYGKIRGQEAKNG
jgi:hypothetical protein